MRPDAGAAAASGRARWRSPDRAARSRAQPAAPARTSPACCGRFLVERGASGNRLVDADHRSRACSLRRGLVTPARHAPAGQSPLSRVAMSGLTARLAFGLVIAVATTLRAIHLAWGLPSFDHPDSLIYFVQPAAQLVAARQLVPPQFVHPPGLVYALGLVYLLWSTLSSHAIILTNPGFTAELPTLVLVGRAVCSGIGVASVAVLYLLARRLAGTRAALL